MNRLVVALVSVIGCGNSGSPATPDSTAGSGSSADAASVDPAVHVHVTSIAGDGLPDPTAVVIFMDASNTPVKDQMVDTNGDAVFDLPAGAVTVLQRGQSERLVTFHGVKAGDHLRAGVPYNVALPATATPHPMTITLPTDAADAAIAFECGGASSTSSDPLTIEFYDACRTTTFDLLATHQPANQPLEWVWQTGIAYQEHGQFMLSDSFAPVAMTSTLISNIPENLTRIAPQLYTIVGGMRVQFAQLDAEVPAAGDQTFAMRYPGAAGNATELDILEVRSNAPSEEHVAVTHGSPATLPVDLSELPLPTFPTTPHETSTSVTWTETGAARGDARYVLWAGRNVSWISIEDPNGPGSPSTLLPLPDAYAADDPTRNGTAPDATQALVAYVDYDNLDGFDAARPLGTALMNVAAMFLDVEHRAHLSQVP